MSDLPIELTRYFPDSQLTWESYDKASRRLLVRVEKDVGPDSGVVHFYEVSYVSLPTSCTGERIQTFSLTEASAEFWSRCKMPRECMDADGRVIEIEDKERATHYVFAKSLEYRIQP